jgi:hypothetical protein
MRPSALHGLTVLSLATLSFVNVRPQAPGHEPCYVYDRDTVSLSGKTAWRVYAGRPNYESVKDGDQPDTVVVLQLSNTICLVASPDHDAEKDVREVQLIVPEKDFRSVIKQPGTRLTLKGTLTGAVFGWHHLDVLFETRLPSPPRTARG